MKEPYGERAIHSGPESCVVVRKGYGEALIRVRLGWALSRGHELNVAAWRAHVNMRPTDSLLDQGPVCRFHRCRSDEA
jgi:hypothetical protein